MNRYYQKVKIGGTDKKLEKLTAKNKVEEDQVIENNEREKNCWIWRTDNSENK